MESEPILLDVGCWAYAVVLRLKRIRCMFTILGLFVFAFSHLHDFWQKFP